MDIILDTCALITFMNGEPMRRAAIRAIGDAQRRASVLVPSVAALEIARKVALGRLRLSSGTLPRVWFARALSEPGFKEWPITAEIAIAAYELPEPFHKDPADRLIVATARLVDAPVVTVDRKILAYGQLGHVRTVAY
jgi:PIN domain nuclease of toxin-antitoxin system